ncbi:MAG: B12-binding domain-containing radical SAM protein [Proteobacteria bacterium]|nr:B12-binding domain-containing radical SAM protein [Pseudomonadota bacterium]MBU1708562.1 B12-binding domain-containing radical SAM protein [Pseudomonadota bacterium]
MKTIRKISLITPPYHSGVVESAGTWMNLGFVYIAGSLRQAGYEVDYYDAMSLWHELPDIRKRIEDFKPDVVATTSFTASILDAQDVMRLAKKINPEIITVAGNVHATFCFQELLSQKDSGIDFIIKGEGEITFPALLDCLNARGDLNKVNGLAFKEKQRIISTPPAAFIENLDSLPAAWDLVEWPIYSYRPKKNSTLAIVSSSRGCSQNCSFCSQQLFWKKTWRARSPENFVAELEMLNRKFGVTVAMLADEIPTRDRNRWEQILDLIIERDPGVRLLMETRVDDILRDEDILEKYNRAGIEHIYVGVEAGSQATLDLFKKGTKVEQSKKAIDLINQADIVSETSFVLGMPDETSESIEKNIELAIHYNPDMAFFLALAPWPYADLYPKLKKYVATKDYRKYNLVEPVLKPKNMTLEEVEKELGRAARTFFMHKFKNLKQLSPWKQEFMVEVFRLLINNSYLAGQMREMAGKGEEMPREVREVLKSFTASENNHIGPFPPIP